jgi:hypothetical protein
MTVTMTVTELNAAGYCTAAPSAQAACSSSKPTNNTKPHDSCPGQFKESVGSTRIRSPIIGGCQEAQA